MALKSSRNGMAKKRTKAGTSGGESGAPTLA
jgi:hypothetical protein